MQKYLQLSISSVQFCSSSGYLRRSIIQAAVVVILGRKKKSLLTCLIQIFLWLHLVERSKYIFTDTWLFLLKYCIHWLFVTNTTARLCHWWAIDSFLFIHHCHSTASFNHQQSVYPGKKKSSWIRIVLILSLYSAVVWAKKEVSMESGRGNLGMSKERCVLHILR